VPSACFADTRFFVDSVTVTDTPNAPPAAPIPGPAAAASTAPGR
jgi:hypothetical protein